MKTNTNFGFGIAGLGAYLIGVQYLSQKWNRERETRHQKNQLVKRLEQERCMHEISFKSDKKKDKSFHSDKVEVYIDNDIRSYEGTVKLRDGHEIPIYIEEKPLEEFYKYWTPSLGIVGVGTTKMHAIDNYKKHIDMLYAVFSLPSDRLPIGLQTRKEKFFDVFEKCVAGKIL